MEEVPYDAYVQPALQTLSEGAFLTVKAAGEVNTMTIGWGEIGYIWGKPVFMVLVRKSRYTYQLLEQADDFTVSLPLSGQLQEELNFCGTESGRDYDKFSHLDLATSPAHQVASPLISDCDLHYECKINFQTDMNPEDLAEEINQQLYPGGDYHTLYFGEIVGSYKA